MESRMREIRTYGLGRQEAGNRFLTFIRRPLCRDFSRWQPERPLSVAVKTANESYHRYRSGHGS